MQKIIKIRLPFSISVFLPFIINLFLNPGYLRFWQPLKTALCFKVLRDRASFFLEQPFRRPRKTPFGIFNLIKVIEARFNSKSAYLYGILRFETPTRRTRGMDMNIFDTFVAAKMHEPSFRPYLWSWIYVPLHLIPRKFWAGKPIGGVTQDFIGRIRI